MATHGLAAVSVLLVLKAFSAGCSALTGVEAIANGVPLFKEPRVARAKRTELLLGVILAAMLLGLAVLATLPRRAAHRGTVLSQIMVAAVGRHWAYYVVSLTITLVLALAANTSFGGLPVLTSLLPRDNYLPHLFGVRDNRLVFGNGVWALAVFSGVLLVAVGGNTNTLIPLFAIGVFIGFTLSQSGLVVHWRRTRAPAGRAVPPSTASAPASRPPPRSSSCSPSSSRVPGSWWSPSRSSSCCSTGSRPTTATPPLSSTSASCPPRPIAGPPSWSCR